MAKPVAVRHVSIHDDLREKLERIQALSFVLGKANDDTDVDTSDYTATVAYLIHDLATEARVLHHKIEDKDLIARDKEAA